MSLRELVDADCGGANALMRMGSHFARDHAHKDDGLGGPAASSAAGMARNLPAHSGGDPMVNEFLGQVRAMPPQTFRMDALLQEMRDIDAQQFHAQLARAPPVIDEVVHRGAAAGDWAKEFGGQPGGAEQQHQQLQHMLPAGPMAMVRPTGPAQPWEMDAGAGAMFSRDFFDAKFADQIPPAADAVLRTQHDRSANDFTRYLQSMRDRTMVPMSSSFAGGGIGGGTMAVMPPGTMLAKDFFDQQQQQPDVKEGDADAFKEAASSWAQDFEEAKQGECEFFLQLF